MKKRFRSIKAGLYSVLGGSSYVQAWAVRREKVETFTRFRLPGEGGNRNQIQRWCRGDNRQSGRRLIQPQTPDLTITRGLGLAGGALSARDRVVHLCAFQLQEMGSHGQSRGGNLARSSRRMRHYHERGGNG